MARERERLLAANREETAAPDVEADADRLLGYLDKVEETFRTGPVAERNRLMKGYVNRVELYHEVEQRGKGAFCRLVRGVLDTRDVLGALPPEGPNSGGAPQGAAEARSTELSGLVGRGDRI